MSDGPKNYRRIPKIVQAVEMDDRTFLVEAETNLVFGSRVARHRAGWKLICDGEPDEWISKAEFEKNFREVTDEAD